MESPKRPAQEGANHLKMWGKNTPDRGESRGPNGENQLRVFQKKSSIAEG